MTFYKCMQEFKRAKRSKNFTTIYRRGMVKLEQYYNIKKD